MTATPGFTATQQQQIRQMIREALRSPAPGEVTDLLTPAGQDPSLQPHHLPQAAAAASQRGMERDVNRLHDVVAQLAQSVNDVQRAMVRLETVTETLVQRATARENTDVEIRAEMADLRVEMAKKSALWGTVAGVIAAVLAQVFQAGL